MLLEIRFVRDENEVARQSLRDEHAVERFPVNALQGPGASRVLHRYGQFLKPLACDGSWRVKSDNARFGEFAKPVLGGYLPG